ncbi:unnamed protein product [Closterium sp. Naga37s-1]|nr:unnamed protein product [Closterium sp. Naga37s-1]
MLPFPLLSSSNCHARQEQYLFLAALAFFFLVSLLQLRVTWVEKLSAVDLPPEGFAALAKTGQPIGTKLSQRAMLAYTAADIAALHRAMKEDAEQVRQQLAAGMEGVAREVGQLRQASIKAAGDAGQVLREGQEGLQQLQAEIKELKARVRQQGEELSQQMAVVARLQEGLQPLQGEELAQQMAAVARLQQQARQKNARAAAAATAAATAAAATAAAVTEDGGGSNNSSGGSGGRGSGVYHRPWRRNGFRRWKITDDRPQYWRQRVFEKYGAYGFVKFSAYRMSARRIAIIGMVPVDMEGNTRLTDCTWHGSDGSRVHGDLTISLVGKHHNYIYDVAVLLCTFDSATKAAGGHLEARIEQEILYPYREEASEPLDPPSPLPLNIAACISPIHGSIDVRRLLKWLHFHRVLLPVDSFLPALQYGRHRGQWGGVGFSTNPSLPETTLPFSSPLSLPLQPLEPPSPLPLNVAACVSPIHGTIDARRLLEWLHFHRVLLPVDRFLLYDAGGIAGNGEAGAAHKEVQRVLAPRVKRGMVDVTWGFREVLQWDVWNYGEHLAIQDCIYRTRNAARWLLVSDIDEYLQIPPPLSLPALLQEHESLPWLTFGATAFNGSFCSPLQLPPQAAGRGEGEGEGGGGGEGNGGGEEGEEERKRAAAMAANEAKSAFAVERMRFRWVKCGVGGPTPCALLPTSTAPASAWTKRAHPFLTFPLPLVLPRRWPHPVCSATDVYSPSQCLDEEGTRRYILDPRRVNTATANSVASSRPGINLPVETARLARFPGFSQSGFATCTLAEPSDSWWEREEGVAALAEAARRCPALKPWTKGASAEKCTPEGIAERLSGGIDPHTHLAMPFMGTESCDDFYSGQAAALAGGTTFHIDYVLGATPAAGEDLLRILAEYEGKARGNAVMDYGFHMGVTRWSEAVARDMEEVVRRGINSFKFFMAYKGALQVDDQQLLDGFTHCKQLGAIPQVHAENGDAVVWGQQHIFDLGITGPEGHPLSRPPEVEEEATGRAIRLANVVGVPLYVAHVMSSGAAREVAEARRRGQRVVGEPVVSGIALNDSHLWSPDFKHTAQFVMSPPIRSAEHVAAVKAALATGTLQLVATDHCPFNSSQKAKGRHDFRLIPNGVNGIEERMHITWDVMVNSGLMSPSDYVRITSTECARIFNLYPQKGVVAEGSDADVIVLNPRGSTTISAATHHSRIDTNVYEGWRMQVSVVNGGDARGDSKGTTISAASHHSRIDTNVYEGWHIQSNIEVTGRVVWQHGRLNVTRGAGRFVPMRPFGPLFHGIQARDAARLHSYHAPVRRDGDGSAADA